MVPRGFRGWNPLWRDACVSRTDVPRNFQLICISRSLLLLSKRPAIPFLYVPKLECILIDLTLISPKNPTEIKMSNSVESYDEKTAKNHRICYVAEKLMVSKLLKISISNFNSTNWRLEWRFCQNVTSLCLILSEKSAVKQHYGRRPGRF